MDGTGENGEMQSETIWTEMMLKRDGQMYESTEGGGEEAGCWWRGRMEPQTSGHRAW